MDTDDIFESLVEASDILLERIDSCLDEASGLRKNRKPVLPKSMQQSTPVVSSWNKSGRQTNEDKVRFLHAKNILRPQLKFKEKPENNNVPFVPIIKVKPNALKPLEEQISLEVVDDPGVPSALANFIHEQRIGASSNHNTHPYKFELDQFEPSSEDMKSGEETMYKPLEETELIFVETNKQLSQLLEVLKNVEVFAVDLEHHSFRSFLGIVCLMQISTWEQDYLIDTLELRSQLPQLNEVFTDPKILKVMYFLDWG
jgi:exosome complex exonuclease RRP6